MTASQQVTAALASNVKTLRGAAGLSQRALAAKAGLTGPTVTFLERQERPTTLAVLFALSEVLGVSPARLVTPASCPQCHDLPPSGMLCTLCRRTAA